MRTPTMWPCCTVPPPGKKWRSQWKDTFLEDGACVSARQKKNTNPFQLNTKEAGKELVVHVNGNTLPPCANPRYLGVTLDRTLSFKQHVSNICAKVSARNSIIRRLCGTTWGASAATLRTATQAIVMAPAEYCAPTWERSSHCRKLDTCLNTAFRTISGCLRATPVDNLPVLAGMAPPRLRRKAVTIDTIAKAANSPSHLVYDRVTKQRKSPRLKSRKPFHKEVEALRLDAEEKHPGKKWLRDRWQSEWQNNSRRLRAFLPEASIPHILYYYTTGRKHYIYWPTSCHFRHRQNLASVWTPPFLSYLLQINITNIFYLRWHCCSWTLFDLSSPRWLAVLKMSLLFLWQVVQRSDSDFITSMLGGQSSLESVKPTACCPLSLHPATYSSCTVTFVSSEGSCQSSNLVTEGIWPGSGKAYLVA